jgi:hypothetical protein
LTDLVAAAAAAVATDAEHRKEPSDRSMMASSTMLSPGGLTSLADRQKMYALVDHNKQPIERMVRHHGMDGSAFRRKLHAADYFHGIRDN